MSQELFPQDGEILTVSDYLSRIQHLLTEKVPQCWIRGEISNLRQQSSGHAYFSIKDDTGTVSVVLFKGIAERHALKDGQQVLILGESSIYGPRGQFQLIGRQFIDVGKGALQQRFEKLKQKLQQEGLFDAQRKKPIPTLPKTIGLITSPTGAAIRDFIEILKRRHWKGTLLVFPCQVQGQSAHLDIQKALRQAEQYRPACDLLVLMRGGGSLEDLWCFNEESLVRAVASCTIPTISAVGHQIDFVLTDFSADFRAETPSAAAELISSHLIAQLQRLETLKGRLYDHAQHNMQLYIHRCQLLREKLIKYHPKAKTEHAYMRLDDLKYQLEQKTQWILQNRALQLKSIQKAFSIQSMQKVIQERQNGVQHLRKTLQNAAIQTVNSKKQAYLIQTKTLEKLHFETTLKRGYCLAEDSFGERIRSIAQLLEGQPLHLTFTDGHVAATITEISPKRHFKLANSNLCSEINSSFEAVCVRCTAPYPKGCTEESPDTTGQDSSYNVGADWTTCQSDGQCNRKQTTEDFSSAKVKR